MAEGRPTQVNQAKEAKALMTCRSKRRSCPQCGTNRAKYGEPGSAIEGSAYVRDYCAICGEPIRVRSIQTANICADHSEYIE